MGAGNCRPIYYHYILKLKTRLSSRIATKICWLTNRQFNITSSGIVRGHFLDSSVNDGDWFSIVLGSLLRGNWKWEHGELGIVCNNSGEVRGNVKPPDQFNANLSALCASRHSLLTFHVYVQEPCAGIASKDAEMILQWAPKKSLELRSLLKIGKKLLEADVNCRKAFQVYRQ